VADIKEGIGWLLRHRYLRLLALMGLVLGLLDEAVFAVFAVFVLYAQDVLGLTASGYGLLLAVGAVGGILGSFVVENVVRRVGSGGAIFLSLILGLISYVGIALSGNVIFVGLMLAVNGFHLVLWNVTTISLRQAIVPAELLGRVNSAYRFLMMAGLTSGTLAGGAIASAFGLTAPFWFAAALLAVLVLTALANARASSLR
jgi:predicted MFS family arabinose efflux permease